MELKEEKRKILVYCCENSSYKAAQAVEDEEILDAVEIVPLPCSGKFEIGLALKNLEMGYPGVMILGCPKDNCKYIRGNYRAGKRTEMVREMLSQAGLDGSRVKMDFLSSLDTHKFVQIVGEMKAALAKE